MKRLTIFFAPVAAMWFGLLGVAGEKAPLTHEGGEKSPQSSLQKEAHGFDPSVPQVTKLAENIYQYFHLMYNSLIVITDDQVIVTDPAGDERAKSLQMTVKKLTGRSVSRVIYTHDHFDHTRGGKVFKDEGAIFVAHEKAVELLSRDPYGQVILPDQTYRDRLSFSLNEGTLELHYFGPNDGDAMSVLYFPKQKILFAVDFHLPRYVNEGYRLTAHNYGGIYQTMKRIRKELSYDIVVSGHTAHSSPELFEEDFRFVEALYQAVYEGLRKGQSVDELAGAIKLPAFAHWRGYEANLPHHVRRMAYTIWHGN